MVAPASATAMIPTTPTRLRLIRAKLITGSRQCTSARQVCQLDGRLIRTVPDVPWRLPSPGERLPIRYEHDLPELLTGLQSCMGGGGLGEG